MNKYCQFPALHIIMVYQRLIQGIHIIDSSIVGLSCEKLHICLPKACTFCEIMIIDKDKVEKISTLAGLEPAISGVGNRRLIH